MLPPAPVSERPVTVATLSASAAGRTWQVGTILNAVAVSVDDRGKVRLQIGARTVAARTDLPLQPGQSLRLRVAQTGSTVVLKSLDDLPETARIREAVRHALPRQAPQTGLLAVAAGAGREAAALPEPLRVAVTRLLAVMNRPVALTAAAGLQRAVRDSGLFLEGKLANSPTVGAAALQTDWKTALLRFSEQVRVAASSTPMPAAPTDSSPQRAAPARLDRSAVRVDGSPPTRDASPSPAQAQRAAAIPVETAALVSELGRATDAALARVRVNQLQSVNPEAGAKVVWLVELPVLHPDNRTEVVTLRIERDERETTGASNAAWTVDLAFDLAARGMLRARVTLRAGKVYASFSAGEEATRHRVQDGLDDLRRALEDKALGVGCLSCGTQTPPSRRGPGESLVETTA